MIGMSQIKKKTLQGVVIGACIGIVGIGLTIWWAISTIKGYKEGTNKDYLKNYTQNVVVCNREVIQGEVLTSDMLTVVANVNKHSVPTGAMKSTSEATDKVAKYNIPANAPIVSTMLSDDVQKGDIREQELNAVLMPTDLAQNDYVDIRLMLPDGTDYVVVAQKEVKKIIGSTFWIDIGEDERLLLSSAMVDSYLNQGSKLYATKYSDPSAQVKLQDTAITKAKGYVSQEIAKQLDTFKTATADQATDLILNLAIKYKNFADSVTKQDANYQPNQQVQDLMKTNKNIVDEAKTKLSSEARKNLENGLKNYKSDNKDQYGNIISGAQQSITAQQNERKDSLNKAQ